MYFVKVIEKGTANEDLSDPYGHYIAAGEKYFSGYYMKSVRSRNSNKKKFQLLPTKIVFSPDEVFDAYVEFNDDLTIETNTSNDLIQKAASHL
mgnify:CR=1 FL=1